MKTAQFPSFGRQTQRKNFIFIRQIQGSGGSANVKTTCFTVFPALFSVIIQARCWKTSFFHCGNVAVVRVLGSPEGPRKAPKATFRALLKRFGLFWGLFQGPKCTKIAQGLPGPYWAILGHPRPSWAILGHPGPSWAVLGNPGPS